MTQVQQNIKKIQWTEEVILSNGLKIIKKETQDLVRIVEDWKKKAELPNAKINLESRIHRINVRIKNFHIAVDRVRKLKAEGSPDLDKIKNLAVEVLSKLKALVDLERNHISERVKSEETKEKCIKGFWASIVASWIVSNFCNDRVLEIMPAQAVAFACIPVISAIGFFYGTEYYKPEPIDNVHARMQLLAIDPIQKAIRDFENPTSEKVSVKNDRTPVLTII